jgi:signal transduction histidine kinase
VEPKDSLDLSLAGLVHDLNNVFETIAEASEVLSTDEKWEYLAAAIQRSAERGRRIVGSYAGSARAGIGVEEVLQRAISYLRDLLTLLPRPQVAFDLDIEPGLRLRGSSSDWERVFMNLFLNAAQAMESGGRIEVKAFQAPGDHCCILVTDNGPGIPQSILGDIFKPHFSTRSAHSGLGLHIVDSIVQSYGGCVIARNLDSGTGARFEITIPPAAA